KVTGQEDEVGFPGDELCQAAPESADWLPWAEVRIGDLQNPERPLGKDARSTSPISFDRYPGHGGRAPRRERHPDDLRDESRGRHDRACGDHERDHVEAAEHGERTLPAEALEEGSYREEHEQPESRQGAGRDEDHSRNADEEAERGGTQTGAYERRQMRPRRCHAV